MPRVLPAALLILALAISACGSDEEAEPAPGGAAVEQREERAPEPRRPAEPEELPAGVEISTAESQFGEVLFDGDGQAIYYFEPERSSEPACYGSCAEAWPPVLAGGEPQASGDVRRRLLGTTERRDGSMQVTYDGRPLYYYADEAPGELRCHNILHEGGLWLAVQPDGAPVPHDPAETIDIG